MTSVGDEGGGGGGGGGSSGKSSVQTVLGLLGAVTDEVFLVADWIVDVVNWAATQPATLETVMHSNDTTPPFPFQGVMSRTVTKATQQPHVTISAVSSVRRIKVVCTR
jgi:hypothetical protein